MWTCYLATFTVHIKLLVLNFTHKGMQYGKVFLKRTNRVKELMTDKILVLKSYYRCFCLKTEYCYDLLWSLMFPLKVS